MKLWLLECRDEIDAFKGYDVAVGFVVRAETETLARLIAQENGIDETHGDVGEGFQAWTDTSNSTCVELVASGAAGLVLRDTIDV